MNCQSTRSHGGQNRFPGNTSSLLLRHDLRHALAKVIDSLNPLIQGVEYRDFSVTEEEVIDRVGHVDDGDCEVSALTELGESFREDFSFWLCDE